MSILWRLIGYLMLSMALLVDPFIVCAMAYLLMSIKDVVIFAFIGACLLLWCKSEHKPFHSWKPSVIKGFLKNWKEISN